MVGNCGVGNSFEACLATHGSLNEFLKTSGLWMCRLTLVANRSPPPNVRILCIISDCGTEEDGLWCQRCLNMRIGAGVGKMLELLYVTYIFKTKRLKFFLCYLYTKNFESTAAKWKRWSCDNNIDCLLVRVFHWFLLNFQPLTNWTPWIRMEPIWN